MDPRSAPWYYLHVEAYQKGVVAQQGPIPFDELHVMYMDGKVERDTFVWSECHEADDFFQIESVPELVAALEVPLEGDAAKAGDFFHQLHHRYFECNYGTSEIPFDKWFGTFHDGSAEATVRTRAFKKQMYT